MHKTLTRGVRIAARSSYRLYCGSVYVTVLHSGCSNIYRPSKAIQQETPSYGIARTLDHDLSVDRKQTPVRHIHNFRMPAKADKGTLEVPNPPLDTPSLSDKDLCYSYEIARGEMGVLSFEPYKSLVLPYWAFRTVPIAKNSAEVLWAIFQSYVERGDFVGADMTRKFIQMGMTRAKRYANHKGGRKYGKDGKQLDKWSGDDVDGRRREKEEASELFKGYWRRCTADEEYLRLKTDWQKSKKEYSKAVKEEPESDSADE